ncbi:hypothetical protein LCGC14_0825740 [marine sediment metagenome]|uniref:Uncharacterized protein n=1 Tax=marine sediment metagenome TaxID=412755 RepID=A0A0F9SPY4_9ZZZZ
MSTAVSIGTLSANGSVDINVAQYHGRRWTLMISGTTWGTGSPVLTVHGGDGSTFVPVNKTTAGATHVALSIQKSDLNGLYVFEADCTALRFTLAGATGSPNIVLALFPSSRP